MPYGIQKPHETMKARISSLAELPRVLIQANTPPPAPVKRIASKATLEIENLHLTRSAAGFSLRGLLKVRRVVAQRIVKAETIEVSGWGFTTGRAANALFKDAIKFIPRGEGSLKVNYPRVTPEMLANCS